MDEKIKKDMKEASEKYVIKLTSNEILNAYELKQEKKRNKVFDIRWINSNRALLVNMREGCYN